MQSPVYGLEKYVLQSDKGVGLMLYLAYGSNMNQEQMKTRCPNATFYSSGYLEGYKLVFDGYSENRDSLVADIRPDAHSRVPYVIWALDDEDLKQLDRCEGYPKHYSKIELKIGDTQCAVAYVMTENKRQTRRDQPYVTLTSLPDFTDPEVFA
jgi:gamma-glutamylcyclotransferase (GGCT)/AIG2-like uncharacterized protein YtfP